MKKGLKLLTCGVICMSSFAWKVNAEEVNVADLVSLKTCIAKTGNVCKLDNDIEVTETLNITDGVEVTVDLNGHNIANSEANVDPLFYINNGSLDVTGTGTITAPKDTFSLLGNTVVGGAATTAKLKIDSEVEVVSDTSNCIYLKGKGAQADVYGNLLSKSTKYATIQGNGSVSETVDNGNTVINIYEGASVINYNNFAIYHPQSGTLTVNGGIIQGMTGIEMRSGNLIVNGGRIVGEYVPTDVEANGNGSTTNGAGIAVAQHTTENPINVTISGGTIEGYTALYESNPEENAEASIKEVNIKITGGTFNAINGGTNAVYSENLTNFITNGNFNTDVTKYLSSVTELNKTENGYEAETVYEVTKGENQEVTATKSNEVTFTIDVDYELFDELYINGTLVPKENYTVKSGSTIITLNSNYVNTLATGEYEVTATFTDGGTATTTLKLLSTTESKVDNPKTSDNLVTYIVALAASVLGILTLGTKILKPKKANN